MTSRRAPSLDARRAPEFTNELLARARTWIPTWGLADDEADFGRALLEIAARFSAEVAERLDGAGEKMRRGFLDWLAVRGEAAVPARAPVAFKLADTATAAVLARHPVRLQADASGASVILETEKDVNVVPGLLDVVVATDAAGDAFYLPPPGLSDLEPREPAPDEWELKSFASAGATKLQLDPEAGLNPGLIFEAAGQQYELRAAEKGIVTIEPPLSAELPAGTIVRKVSAFEPFDGAARNRQEHALYLGDTKLLDVEAAATIDVVGARALGAGITWQYWGKVEGGDVEGWQPLTIADQQPKSDALVLTKGKGAVVPKEIGGKSSRWIRGVTAHIDAKAPLATVDAFRLRINCPTTGAAPAADGFTNTTPLVLEGAFFPFGKEPRQFDAFYLGSQEAFSKKDADVALAFQLADPTFAALSGVPAGVFGKPVLAGVGMDQALHLLELDPTSGAISKLLGLGPLQPPLPRAFGGAPSGPTNPVALDRNRSWRPPIHLLGNDFVVAVTAGDAVWSWYAHFFDSRLSGWIDLGRLPPTTQGASPTVDGLVYLDSLGKLVALRGGLLYVRDPATGTWNEVQATYVDPVTTAKKDVSLTSIAPLLDQTSGRLVRSATGDIVGIGAIATVPGNAAFRITVGGSCTRLLKTVNDFAANISPVVVRDAVANTLTFVAAVTGASPPRLVAESAPAPVALAVGQSVMGVDVALAGGTSHLLVSVRDAAGDRLVTWAPSVAGVLGETLESQVTPSGTSLGGPPTLVGTKVVIPGTRADVLVNDFDPSRRILTSADLEMGIRLPDFVPPLAKDDLVVRAKSPGAVTAVTQKVADTGTAQGSEVLYKLDAPFPDGTTGELSAFRATAKLTGADITGGALTLDPLDGQTREGDWVLIPDLLTGDVFRLGALTAGAFPLIPVDPVTAVPADDPNASYIPARKIAGRVAPDMDLNPVTNGNWEAALLDRVPLYFPNAGTPKRVKGKAFATAGTNPTNPTLVALLEEFVPVLKGLQPLFVDAAFAEWKRNVSDVASNPDLSWEYWNGTGWWRLGVTLDETVNLKASGKIKFTVPDDIASSDWAGKTNFWIRARLVGGDYGQETVTVVTVPAGTGTKQTVVRSNEGIRPPSVVELHITYEVCREVPPAFLQTQDSGSLRDQSDANTTAGAIVEAFVPLSVTLERLARGAAGSVPADPASGGCSPGCGCGGAHATTAPAAPASTPPATGATLATAATGRALFIGLTVPPSDAPVNVLLLVAEERNHGAFAPVKIATLVSDRFEPVVADDASRAVGESGILSMTFTIRPTVRDLFGRQCAWICITPAGPPSDSWKPTLRGAYLNAAWASAMETLTRELVGSSDGAPNLALTLARPPVLKDTLELRVKEPLGEEERTKLRANDPRDVLDDVKDLPGDWVLWRPVIDPGDEGPGERVYALDENTGTIRFGDGLHGMIPPIGRDSIVAFSYQRTEAGPLGNEVPGNAIAPRTALNLVTPLEAVESAIAADQAAGGAPPESDDRVARFGSARLRHRDRAVTPEDIEDLVLQSSPDFAQARCLPGRGHVRLIVVRRGGDPAPNASQVRELGRLLRAAAPVSLSAPGALKIEAPRVRRLRIDLTLRVDRLDNAGALGDWVKTELRALIDTATGGRDRGGWRLGDSPKEEDVALRLVEAPYLESIGDVKLFESPGDRADRAWPAALGPNELAMLAKDPIRIQFVPVEAAA